MRTADARSLKAMLGPGAAALAALVPEVRSALPKHSPVRLGAAHERVGLYDAVRQLLGHAAGTPTMEIVLLAVLSQTKTRFREQAHEFGDRGQAYA